MLLEEVDSTDNDELLESTWTPRVGATGYSERWVPSTGSNRVKIGLSWSEKPGELLLPDPMTQLIARRFS